MNRYIVICGDASTKYRTHLDSRNVVSSGVKLGVGCSTVLGRTHTVVIVLTDEETGELPQSSHVEGLKDLALVGCSITIHSDTDTIRVVVLESKGNASSQRNLRIHTE